MSLEATPWQLAEGEDLLEVARAAGVLTPLDHQFAERLAAIHGESSVALRWALAIACRQEAAGHVCADLTRLAEEGLTSDAGRGGAEVHSLCPTEIRFDDWIDALAASPLVEDRRGASGTAPGPDVREDGGGCDSGTSSLAAPPPLVLTQGARLYLRRAFRSEARLAEQVLARTARADLAVDADWAQARIDRLLAADEAAPVDSVGAESAAESGGEGDTAPRRALWAALTRPLAIVTGGPGTGKTTLVARLVGLLIEAAQTRGDAVPKVRLLAPTGKAAAAMTSSFARQRDSLDVSEAVRAALPTSAETIHRVLYRQTRRDGFGRPLPFELDADLVVIDEASMVDLDLMARLFEACASVERVVLLGDPGQLASVDSGAVLADLCERPASGPKPSGRSRAAQGPAETGERSLADSIVTLRTSHRYAAGGGIGRLAQAIREGDADAAIGLLDDPEVTQVERCPASSIGEVRERLVRESVRLQQEIAAAPDAFAKLDRLALYRVLCAHRRGPLGVEALGAVLDESGATARRTTSRSGWWLGRLLLVTRNAPEQDLWNGDVGLIEETSTGLRALFPDGAGGVRALSAGRLPAHESAMAMSVHKSQGSEFDVVDLVLGNQASRLMTRELLYTGVTRARKALRIHASEALIREAIGRRVQRDSGLRERLWPHGAE